MFEEYMSVLSASPLFLGFEQPEISALIDCFRAKIAFYDRGEIILLFGEKVERIGILLDGYVDIVQQDFWGNQMLLSRIGPGQIFADSFVLAKVDALPFTAFSHRRAAVLWLEYVKMKAVCVKACTYHLKLVENLLSISAKKNINLLTKINHLSKRTLREKLLSYLSYQARMANNNVFTIEFNRQGLADYLGVDRSALSAELSRMQRDGLLSYKKNVFELHHDVSAIEE